MIWIYIFFSFIFYYYHIKVSILSIMAFHTIHPLTIVQNKNHLLIHLSISHSDTHFKWSISLKWMNLVFFCCCCCCLFQWWMFLIISGNLFVCFFRIDEYNDTQCVKMTFEFYGQIRFSNFENNSQKKPERTENT